MSHPLHVVVVGAGIGGLCLAQGLRRAGVSVAVYERDTAPGSRREGFRIHVDPVGARSLRACLPPQLWEAFLASSGAGGDFGFHTEQLRELVVVEEEIMYPGSADDPAQGHYHVDRATLRRLLLAGLDDAVHFGAEFVRYEHTPDGRIAAVFADGRRAVGDVLVGADGSGSRVRRRHLPQAGQDDAAVCGIAHKVPLTEEARRWVPPRLQTGMNAVLVDAPVALFTSVYEPPRDAAAALRRAGVTPPDGEQAPYLMCALLAAPGVLPPDVTTLGSAELARAVDACVAGWHPDLRRLLAESDPASRAVQRFVATRDPGPWAPSRITLLGDAIHTMPPIGGFGGNTAMRDAHLLARMLAGADRGLLGLLGAVGRYEREMRDHGFAAVRGALAGRDEMLATGALGLLAARTFFRLCRAVPALRRRGFRSWDTSSQARAWEREEVPTLVA